MMTLTGKCECYLVSDIKISQWLCRAGGDWLLLLNLSLMILTLARTGGPASLRLYLSLTELVVAQQRAQSEVNFQ